MSIFSLLCLFTQTCLEWGISFKKMNIFQNILVHYYDLAFVENIKRVFLFAKDCRRTLHNVHVTLTLKHIFPV